MHVQGFKSNYMLAWCTCIPLHGISPKSGCSSIQPRRSKARVVCRSEGHGRSDLKAGLTPKMANQACHYISTCCWYLLICRRTLHLKTMRPHTTPFKIFVMGNKYLGIVVVAISMTPLESPSCISKFCCHIYRSIWLNKTYGFTKIWWSSTAMDSKRLTLPDLVWRMHCLRAPKVPRDCKYIYIHIYIVYIYIHIGNIYIYTFI